MNELVSGDNDLSTPDLLDGVGQLPPPGLRQQERQGPGHQRRHPEHHRGDEGADLPPQHAHPGGRHAAKTTWI